MRIDAVDGMGQSLLMQLASQLSYVELIGLQGKVHSSSIRKNDGSRFLLENKFRGVDLYEVMRLLNLSNRGNRIMLLHLLKRMDILTILRLLSKRQLIYALRFLNKGTLIRLMMTLPKLMLVKMLLHILPMEKLMERLPRSILFLILRSKKLDNRMLMKGFEGMDLRLMRRVVATVLNRNVDQMNRVEMLAILFNLKKKDILDGLRVLPQKALAQFVGVFTEKDPTLLTLIPPAFMMKLLSKMPKLTLMEMFDKVPNEMIINIFLSQLPHSFLSEIAADVEPGELMGYMISQQAGLLQQLGADLAAA
ncbi:MAG: hypothetical protein AB7P76_02060 [Candidatus Melainabacteria bacterium]